MTVRPTNCDLVGDQLAISGAVADPADNRSPTGSAPARPGRRATSKTRWRRPTSVAHPARLVLIQDGADDIDFAPCLEYELAHVARARAITRHTCVVNGAVTQPVADELADVRASLAGAIETVAPPRADRGRARLLPADPPPVADRRRHRRVRLGTNLVCAGIKLDAAGTYADAQVVLDALNQAIAGAVADAARPSGPQCRAGRHLVRRRRARHVHGRSLGLLRRAGARHDPGGRHRAHPGGQSVQRDHRPARRDVLLASRSRRPSRPSATSRATSGAPHTRRRPGSRPSPGRSCASSAGGDQSMAWRSADTNSDAPSGPAPWRSRRTSAEPTTTPSATSHTSAACAGVDTPTPTHTGMSVCSRMRSTTRADVDTDFGALAGHTHPRHGVDEASGAGADTLHAFGRARRRDQEHGVDAGGVGLQRPRLELLDRQVGHDGPAHTRSGQRARHALVPGPEDDVVVRHDGDGHRVPRPARCRRAPRRDGAPAERTQRRLLDHRAVDHRVRERDADLHGVGSGRDDGRQRLRPSRRSCRPSGTG